MSQSRYLDLDSAIADALRRDFRAMVHALAEADVARAIQTRDEQMDVSVGRSGTRGGEAFAEEGEQ